MNTVYIQSRYLWGLTTNRKDPYQVPQNEPILWRDQLRKSKRLFGYLCESLIEMNKVFSVPVLIFLTTRLISIAFCLYIIIYSLLNANSFLLKLIPIVITFCIVSLVNILCLFLAADLPINQVCIRVLD